MHHLLTIVYNFLKKKSTTATNSKKSCNFAADFLRQKRSKKSKEMAKKNKEARQQVILECTEQKASGVPGMSRYITTKNRKNTPERLELKKYNPYLKRVTVHKEVK